MSTLVRGNEKNQKSRTLEGQARTHFKELSQVINQLFEENKQLFEENKQLFEENKQLFEKKDELEITVKILRQKLELISSKPTTDAGVQNDDVLSEPSIAHGNEIHDDKLLVESKEKTTLLEEELGNVRETSANLLDEMAALRIENEKLRADKARAFEEIAELKSSIHITTRFPTSDKCVAQIKRLEREAQRNKELTTKQIDRLEKKYKEAMRFRRATVQDDWVPGGIDPGWCPPSGLPMAQPARKASKEIEDTVPMDRLNSFVAHAVESQTEKLAADVAQLQLQLAELTDLRKDLPEEMKPKKQETLEQRAKKKYKSLEKVITNLIEANQSLTTEVKNCDELLETERTHHTQQIEEMQRQIDLLQTQVKASKEARDASQQTRPQSEGRPGSRKELVDESQQTSATRRSHRQEGEKDEDERSRRELKLAREEADKYRSMYEEFHSRMQAKFLQQQPTEASEEYFSELMMESQKRIEGLEKELANCRSAAGTGSAPVRSEPGQLPQHIVDEMEALRTQAAAYEEDFKAEREARENAMRLNEELRERMKSTQLRPQEKFVPQPHHRYEPQWLCRRCGERNEGHNATCQKCWTNKM